MRRLIPWIAGWLLGLTGAWSVGATADTSLPLANLAGFGRLSHISLTDAAQRANVTRLTDETNAVALTLVPGTALEFEWDHARPVRAVTLFGTSAPTNATPITVQWWRRIWPDNGTGGWMKLDDPFNGNWTTAKLRVEREGPAIRGTFAPLEAEEAPGIQRRGMAERVTYKLRVLPAERLEIQRVTVTSDARLRQARLRFEWDVKTTAPGKWTPQFEARNGRLLRAAPAGPNAATVEVEYADAPDRLSPDRGFVVFRSGETRSFAVFVDDVLREGGLLVRDIGVFVSDADRNLTYQTRSAPIGEVWSEGTVAEQVARQPEASFDRVSQAIPRKPPPYLFLGVPNLRQEIALLPQGQIQLRADSLRSPGPDANARPWSEDALVYDFGAGAQPSMGPAADRAVERSLAEGWLPVVSHAWTTEEIQYRETCVAAPLMRPIDQLASQTGTEPVVLATRFELKNTAAQSRTAWLWLELSRSDPLQLSVDGTLVLRRPSDGRDRPGFVPTRGRFDTHGRGELDLAVLTPANAGSYNPRLADSRAAREAVRYRVDLAPGESHAIDLLVPYVELLDANESVGLKRLTFTNLHPAVVQFWRERVTRGMTYEVPDRYLNEFFKANLWHVLISTDLDPVTGQHQHGAATHQYGNFLNETAMVARSLEMRGESAAALHLLEPFLANQGVKGLPGNFKSQEGVLYAAHPGAPDPYTAQGYNLHHGWGLWALAEHYFWTRDTNYLDAVAPRLALAADWVTRERQATKRLDPNGTRRIEHGLAPAGDLEDVEEYLYFYATDAYYHLGMKTLADALTSFRQSAGPPARNGSPRPDDVSQGFWDEVEKLAARLTREAAEFRQDIQASVTESVATSPVVRLRDGTYAPWVPTRAYALTHLKEGWIREGLYPALHLVNGMVYDDRHPFVDWMIQELEDNVFLSRECGYGVADPRANFFARGGFTLQPNLLDLALVYLKRDQVPNFLRAFYNTAWASLHPDGMCFAEWVPELGQAGGPLYKTPDECKFIQWMRQMLVLERGDTLELGLGVPRAWMADGQRVRLERAATWFGPLDLEIVSHAAERTVTATVALTPTAKTSAVRLRLRAPGGEPLQSAEVNGRPAKILSERQLIELPVTTNRWQVVGKF